MSSHPGVERNGAAKAMYMVYDKVYREILITLFGSTIEISTRDVMCNCITGGAIISVSPSSMHRQIKDIPGRNSCVPH
jgi:hypothetical protein